MKPINSPLPRRGGVRRKIKIMNKIHREQITAVILAGGKGSRLGGMDKGLVIYRGRPIIEHIIEAISPQVGAIIINANRNLEAYTNYGYPVISDELSDFQGPLAGISAAMSSLTTPYILTLPGDGPVVSSGFVKRLKKAIENSEYNLAVAHDGERMQPAHALIPVNLHNSLATYLHSGKRSIRHWFGSQKHALADFSDTPEIFYNINTKEQLRSL